MSLQLFHELAHFFQLGRDVDLLRTMFFVNATATLYAVVGLSFAGYMAIEADEVAPALFTIIRIGLPHAGSCGVGQESLGFQLVVVGEDGWNVDAVGAGHTVLAGIARDEVLLHHLMGNLGVEQFLFFFRERC